MDEIKNKKQKFQNLKNQIESKKNKCTELETKYDHTYDQIQLTYVLNVLKYKMLTENEIQEKLRLKFPEINGRILERLKSTHLIDDQRLSDIECRNLAERKFYSNARIKFHLCKRGISSSLIEHCLQRLRPEEERAYKLLSKKYKNKSKYDIKKATRLLFSYMYPLEIVKKCVKEFLNEFS